MHIVFCYWPTICNIILKNKWGAPFFAHFSWISNDRCCKCSGVGLHLIFICSNWNNNFNTFIARYCFVLSNVQWMWHASRPFRWTLYDTWYRLLLIVNYRTDSRGSSPPDGVCVYRDTRAGGGHPQFICAAVKNGWASWHRDRWHPARVHSEKNTPSNFCDKMFDKWNSTYGWAIRVWQALVAVGPSLRPQLWLNLT